jgi:hypothetical protein
MTSLNKRRDVPIALHAESAAKESSSIPNGRLLTESIGLSQDRFAAGIKSKVGVPTQVLKELIRVMASTLPFDLDFYLSTYPDIREAYEAGEIADPRTHFVEQGYIEGRLGADPNVDEEFYKNAYPDVKAAIAAGELKSALEHYLRAGAFEARFPNSGSVANTKRWLALLGR